MAKPSKTVLVVEDEKLQSWSLAKTLAKWGYAVSPAYTASDALSLVEKSDYDFVLLDYQLPDLDGLQVAQKVRQVRPGTAIILVTAFQLSELPTHTGLIDDYFNKPVDLQQLHQALKKMSKSREAVKG